MHVVKGRQHSAYKVYINVGASVVDIVSLDLDCDRDELDSAALQLPKFRSLMASHAACMHDA